MTSRKMKRRISLPTCLRQRRWVLLLKESVKTLRTSFSASVSRSAKIQDAPYAKARGADTLERGEPRPSIMLVYFSYVGSPETSSSVHFSFVAEKRNPDGPRL